MLDDLFDLALGLGTTEHLKVLQERSLTHEDRKELLRQEYVELHGQITRDEFTGFMMTSGFTEFLKEAGSVKVFVASAIVVAMTQLIVWAVKGHQL